MVLLGNSPSLSPHRTEEKEEVTLEAGFFSGHQGQEEPRRKERPAAWWAWHRQVRGLATVTCTPRWEVVPYQYAI